MNSLVIDAGIAIRAVLPNPQREHIRRKLDDQKAAQTTLYAPGLWGYETISVLTKAVHFKEISITEAQQALSLLRQMGVQAVPVDAELADAAMAWTFRLKRAAAYDSFYLALAQRLDTVLWTTDKRLSNAIQEDWVCYVGA